MYYLLYSRCNDFWNCRCFCRSVYCYRKYFSCSINGKDVAVDGYNIDGSTYFKLRDIANVIGGFDVDFSDNTIQLSKDGYEYTKLNYSYVDKDYKL